MKCDRMTATVVGFVVLCVLAGCDGGGDEEVSLTLGRTMYTGDLNAALMPSDGWLLEAGMRVTVGAFVDISVVRLADGRYRMYGNSPTEPAPGQTGFDSYISSDGLTFTKESGYRLAGPNVFMPSVIALPDGRFRMYYTDQIRIGDGSGSRAIKSAISSDGLAFTIESGDRLVYTGIGNEEGGIRGGKILGLPDGTYRLYYHGLDADDSWRVLSASSVDGLTWTRDPGVRFDPQSVSPSTFVGNVAPYYADGTYYLYIPTGTAGENYANEEWGIYEFVSSDGLTFTMADDPIVRDTFNAATFTGLAWDPKLTPQDPAVVATDSGLRMYFGIYDGPNLVPESGIYSLAK